MSMHTSSEWHNSAQMNMTNAKGSQRKAHQQCETSKAAHEETVNDNLSLYGQVHETLGQKVRTSYRLREKLQERADSLQNSINLTKKSLETLEAAHRAKEAPLQLCIWRLEQREKRPLREQVRDNVEVALESEHSVLKDTQKRLQDAINRTKNTINVLEDKLADMTHDIEQKTQALGIDEMCLRATHRSFQQTLDRTPRSMSLGGATRLPSQAKKTNQHQVAMHESTKNEVSRQQEAVRLNASAVNREEVAKALREENGKLIARCQRAAQEATAKSERMMQDRINENQKMRRRLETEIRETHGKIDHTKGTMAETRSQIKALEEPVDNCRTCTSWRQQRATKEHIVDPVTTKLQEHRVMLLRSAEELREHHESERSALQHLKQRKESLKEDLRDKTQALHIDLNCLTHEATTMNNGKQSKNLILSKNKMHKAMMVDPSFVPTHGTAYMPNLPQSAR